VFTARYGLISYIKQISFRLLKVKGLRLAKAPKNETFHCQMPFFLTLGFSKYLRKFVFAVPLQRRLIVHPRSFHKLAFHTPSAAELILSMRLTTQTVYVHYIVADSCNQSSETQQFVPFYCCWRRRNY
jgi:hypothetical protein